MPQSRCAIIDGSNVAYLELSRDGDPKIANILAVREAATNHGWDPIVIVDASLRHEIDDAQQLEGLLDDQEIRQAPSGTDADYFIIELAEEQDRLIISDDEFEEFQDGKPWIRSRRVPVMIVEGQVVLDDRNHQPNE